MPSRYISKRHFLDYFVVGGASGFLPCLDRALRLSGVVFVSVAMLPSGDISSRSIVHCPLGLYLNRGECYC
jgi:hypothetical protein